MAVAPELFKPSAVLQLGASDPIAALADLPGLRIAFECNKSLTATPDTLRAEVYNLAPETRELLSQQFTPGLRATCLLNAGYGAAPPRIFLGSITGLQSQIRVGPDVITQIEAADGVEAVTEIPLEIGSAVFTVPQMIDVAIKGIQSALALYAASPTGALMTSLLVGPAPSVAEVLASAQPQKLTQRFPIARVGRAWDLIEEAARILGVHAWVSGGLLHFSKPTPVGPVQPIPEIYWLDAPASDGALTTIPVLMDPLLQPGITVQLTGLGAYPPMRVEAVTYRSDTRGGPSSATLSLREAQYLS